jgi:hypothetical protein
MKRNSYAFGIWIAINLLAASCTMDAQSQEPPDTLNSDGQNAFRAVMVEDVGVEQALGLVIQLRTERATLRLQYPDHQSVVDITRNDIADARAVFAKEKERLTQISSHFSADDAMEAPVKAALDRDLTLINSGAGPHAAWIDFTDGIDPHSPLIARFETIGLTHDDASGLGTTVSALTDYTGDAYYVPAGGTSTVSASGTLQKFWLDPQAKAALSLPQDGLEMDTVISPKSAVTCGSSGVSSNMPNFYMDTEAFDWATSSTSRDCAVGTTNAAALQTWTLYWTWHPFASFATASNPQITVQYQPNKWCWWVTSSSQCESNRPWCMCSRNDLPIEFLIRYNYNEGPGVEKTWVKN